MPLFLLVIAGIVLVLNAGWFAGAALVGWLLIAFGLVLGLIVTLIFGSVFAAFWKNF